MRILLTLMCLPLPLAAAADPLTCSNTGLRPSGVLSATEMQTVTRGIPSSDPVLSEAAFLLKRGSDDISSDQRQKASNIEWPQARRLVLLGAVNRVSYTPGGSVYLGTRSGSVYLTRVAQQSDILDLLKLIDPCRVLIVFWQP
jgi:hypothetical protein